MLASSTHQHLTGDAVRELTIEARRRLRLGKGGYRREHVRAFAQRVEVADDAIYIKGNKNTLLRTLVATKGEKSMAHVLQSNPRCPTTSTSTREDKAGTSVSPSRRH